MDARISGVTIYTSTKVTDVLYRGYCDIVTTRHRLFAVPCTLVIEDDRDDDRPAYRLAYRIGEGYTGYATAYGDVMPVLVDEPVRQRHTINTFGVMAIVDETLTAIYGNAWVDDDAIDIDAIVIDATRNARCDLSDHFADHALAERRPIVVDEDMPGTDVLIRVTTATGGYDIYAGDNIHTVVRRSIIRSTVLALDIDAVSTQYLIENM